MKYKTYLKVRRHQENAKILGIILLILFVLWCGILGFIEYTGRRDEIVDLNAIGMYNVTPLTNEKNVNVTIKGKETPKHTIVSIASVGGNDFNAYVDYLTEPLRAENKIVMIDRLGTGYSDDTFDERTIISILEEYRTVLANKDIPGPYILLTHEYGALYATYWQLIYPDEVEGVIYIDPVLMNHIPVIEEPAYAPLFSLGSKIGLQRWIYSWFHDNESFKVPNIYARAAKALNNHSTYTFGYLSEVKNLNNNYNTLVRVLEPTQSLKMYINSSYGFETAEDVTAYMDYANQREKITSGKTVYNYYKGKQLDSFIEEMISTSTETTNNAIASVAEKLGNCYVVQMPGHNEIYEQMPGVVKAAVKGFVDYLDGKEPAIYERYVDSLSESWKEHAKSLMIDKEE